MPFGKEKSTVIRFGWIVLDSPIVIPEKNHARAWFNGQETLVNHQAPFIANFIVAPSAIEP